MTVESDLGPGDIFSTLYAVVLNHRAASGWRVRWSPEQNAWLRSTDFSRYTPRRRWHDAPGDVFGMDDAPDEEERSAAEHLAISINDPTRPWFCAHCLQDEPRLHFIAPDVYGDPELYCVQMPSYTVVESGGGTGALKHWGSPFGCQSVHLQFDSDKRASSEFLGPQAVYVYGRPLPADEVIDRDWCSRCARAAGNVRANANHQEASEHEWARDRLNSDSRRAQREWERYYGDTSN